MVHSKDFSRATPLFSLRDGTAIKMYKNPAQVDHIFVCDDKGEMVFGGFVTWVDSKNLRQSVAEIKEELS